MPEYDISQPNSASIASKAPSTYSSDRIEANVNTPQYEELAKNPEYPHYRPPQASSYPSVDAPSSEKKPEDEKNKK